MAKPERSTTGPVRCAIYTRKSTEEGLEQEFNSLDAQREACAAYIVSQRHERWVPVVDHYDDGGFSGGSLERPALKQMLADIAAGKIDVIVIYKVDRLTRSLADFSKIVEVLEKAGASFVSVTQAFNTTTSMGRLMLNVLLSFAQFEREVTGERIRDKVAASKRKGMWMGGPVPLGYALADGKLVPHNTEAAQVQLVFERYLALGTLGLLKVDLIARGITSKQREYRDGRVVGGRAFGTGALAHLLKNPIFVGEVRHKSERFPGEHQGIVSRELWDGVQEKLAANCNNHRCGTAADQPSPLAGMMVDGEGRPMSPSHATKGSRRYRYYVTRVDAGVPTPTDAWRVPAGAIEPVVTQGIANLLADNARLLSVLGGEHSDCAMLAVNGAALATRATDMTPSIRRSFLLKLGTRIALTADRINVSLSRASLAIELSGECVRDDGMERVIFDIPAKVVRRGHELRLSFPPADRDAPALEDPKLVELIAKADRAYAELICPGANIDRIRRAHLTRLARLKFLAPSIIVSILEGRQPASLTTRKLLRAPRLALSWADQRRELGFS